MTNTRWWRWKQKRKKMASEVIQIWGLYNLNGWPITPEKGLKVKFKIKKTIKSELIWFHHSFYSVMGTWKCLYVKNSRRSYKIKTNTKHLSMSKETAVSTNFYKINCNYVHPLIFICLWIIWAVSGVEIKLYKEKLKKKREEGSRKDR